MKYVVTLKLNGHKHEFDDFTELVKACKFWNTFKTDYVVHVVKGE